MNTCSDEHIGKCVFTFRLVYQYIMYLINIWSKEFCKIVSFQFFQRWTSSLLSEHDGDVPLFIFNVMSKIHSEKYISTLFIKLVFSRMILHTWLQFPEILLLISEKNLGLYIILQCWHIEQEVSHQPSTNWHLLNIS